MKTLDKLLLLSLLSIAASSEDQCVDVLNWIDSNGNGCEWYADDNDDSEMLSTRSMSSSRCSEYGNCCVYLGHTAKTACCVCGGGEGFLDACIDTDGLEDFISQSSSDSSSSSIDLFSDCNGNSCIWYGWPIQPDDIPEEGNIHALAASTRCSIYGDDEACLDPMTGTRATEACCQCGGGKAPSIYTSTHYFQPSYPSLMPSGKPIIKEISGYENGCDGDKNSSLSSGKSSKNNLSSSHSSGSQKSSKSPSYYLHKSSKSPSYSQKSSSTSKSIKCSSTDNDTALLNKVVTSSATSAFLSSFVCKILILYAIQAGVII